MQTLSQLLRLINVAFISNYHMTRIQSRTSDACTCVYVSLLKGTALVVFKNGGTYAYTNVSRRAILNLMVNPNMSLGMWVNQNCSKSDRAVTSGRWNTVALG